MLIALYSPRPQCGKTTVAQYLKDVYAFKHESFAGPLKNMLETLLHEVGILPPQAWDYLRGNAKEAPIRQLGGLTGRRLMQTLGTEWGRYLDENFWTGVMDAKLDQHPAGRRIVIDDMRFPNEYALLKQKGALMVKVYRGQAAGDRRNACHVSEGSLDHHDFDYEVGNDGDIPLLHAKIDSIIRSEAVRKSFYH